MKDILKILKKHVWKIFFVILFLILLANCDLKLPAYTSDIVNVGITQNGIEKAVPVVLRENTFNGIKLCISADSEILNNYSLISKDSLSKAKYDEYVKLYPSLENENLYILDDVTDSKMQSLEQEMSKALVANNLMTKYNSLINTNDTLMTNYSDISDTIVKQYAINIIKEEYENIGLNIEKLQTDYIINVGIKMLCVTLISVTITILNSYLISKISSMFSKELRSKVVKKVMSFSNEEFEKISASSLITRTTNDIQRIQNLIAMGLRTIVFAPIIGIGAFLKVRNSSMAWVIGIAILAIFVIILILFFIALPKFKKSQELLDKTNLVAREMLTGLPVIRAFSNEKYEEKRFNITNMDLTKVNIFVNKLMSIMMPTMMFIMNSITILIIWVGTGKVDNAILQIGDLMAFIQYSMHIIIAFLMISVLSIMIPRAIVSIKRIAEVLDKEDSIKELEKVKKFNKNKKGEIEFKNVFFRYPDAYEDVLKNISFKVESGQTIAFIGSTGSGKSTLINLIVRFFDVTKGEIIIDGQNIKDVSLKELRDKIGFVPQKSTLFSGTIESNLKLGNDDLSDIEMKKACEIAQALDFIDNTESKYETPISQGGTNVSGGQKQRLAIARAISKNPEFYIFDDSFSALDFKTDSALRKRLKEYTKDSTILIVGQRISSIMNADKIIVLEKGEIVGIGKHEELLKKCDVYREISTSQLGGDL
ncbi:MAG: ABC transporter ATP-binding protein [bacterium]|nr:ABC transporter ATP-binding protein [bacterium]